MTSQGLSAEGEIELNLPGVPEEGPVWFRAAVPNLSGHQELSLLMICPQNQRAGNGFGMTQEHYVYRVSYFYYYSISSVSDHQA